MSVVDPRAPSGRWRDRAREELHYSVGNDTTFFVRALCVRVL